MQVLKTHYHPDIRSLKEKSILERQAARSIAMRGDMILLLYTERYEDYSLPGGGLDKGEDLESCMRRELKEETGARNVQNIKPFGIYEEYRPWYKPDYDIQHMISHCYTCDIDVELDDAEMESYEIKNGMKAVWINIYDAINHNKLTLATSDKKGMSIEREIFLLELISQQMNRDVSRIG